MRENHSCSMAVQLGQTMGSIDGVEICKLVGLFVLNKLTEKFGKENVEQ
jgi:hypothetical protein